jgi:hypothetical protein
VAVCVSGTVTNDNQHAYIKIETLRGKTPSLPPPPPPPPPLPPLPPHHKCFCGGRVGLVVVGWGWCWCWGGGGGGGDGGVGGGGGGDAGGAMAVGW